MVDKHVIVIGGGIGGLAAAVRLVKHCRVTLIEKNERVGGKLNLWEVPHPHRPNDRPFRFDTGPTLLTMPFVIMDLFAAAGQDVRDHLKITKLDPAARFQWGDGMTLELRSDRHALAEQIGKISQSDVAGWMKLLERGRKVWNLGESFLTHAPEQMMRSRGNGLAMLTVPFRIGMFSRYSRVIDRYVRHPRLRDVLYQYATYAGSSPWHAPATLTVIPWVENYFGGWHIEGGMYQLAEKLEVIAQNLGVEIRTNTSISRILVNNAAASGVELADGSKLDADAVIANSDVVYTYSKLIDARYRRKYNDATLAQLDPGGSGMVLMLGVDGNYPQLAHHTKFMPDDYRADLDAMLNTRTIPADPCIYVCAPTRTDPSLAPEGCEIIFVLVSAPAMRNSNIDWSIEGQRYRNQIIKTLEERWGLKDLSKRIVVEKQMNPTDFERRYNANAGSIYGIASNSLRSAFLRPPNRDKDIKRLYFAGGATHPGGGIPLVALSGKIVSELALEDLGVG